MMGQQRPNQVYILRIWRSAVGKNGRSLAHYILEDPFSRARRGFATLQELTLFLDALPEPQSTHQPSDDA